MQKSSGRTIQELQFHQRRRGSYVSVIFSDTTAITLDADLAVRFHLARGMEISQGLLDQMTQEDEILRARRKLIAYLAMRKKSTLQARQYLRKAGFAVEAAEAAVLAASELGYLNDTDFANAFVRTSQKSGKKGPRVVIAELQAKGISRDEATRLTETMAEEEVQLDQARKLAAKKYPSLKDDADQNKAAHRLSRHLARRGFDPDICDRVAREYFGDPTLF